MYIKMNGLYGDKNCSSYFRSLGDICYDFVGNKKYATDLPKEQADNILSRSEWYCKQYNATELIAEE